MERIIKFTEMPHFQVGQVYYDLRLEDRVNDTPEEFYHYIKTFVSGNRNIARELLKNTFLKAFAIKYNKGYSAIERFLQLIKEQKMEKIINFKEEYDPDENKLLAVWGTRGGKDTVYYYQTPTDERYGSFTKKGEGMMGGGQSIDDLPADIANEVVDRFYLNKVKNFMQKEGEVLRADLHYFLQSSWGNLPKFVGPSDNRYNHPQIQTTGMMEITQKNILEFASKFVKS